MIKFNKDFNFGMVAIISIVFLCAATLYASPVSKDRLRVPVGEQSTYNRIKEKLLSPDTPGGKTVLNAQELYEASTEEIKDYIARITNSRYIFQEILDKGYRLTLKVTAADTGKAAVFVISPSDLDLEIAGRLQAAGTRHTNITEVYEVDKANKFWIMEYVDGDDLLNALGKHNLTREETVQVIDQLVDAMIWFENIGIFYKDLDWSNLIISRDSQGGIILKLRDFGNEGIIVSQLALSQRMPSGDIWRKIETLTSLVFEAVSLGGSEREKIFLKLRDKYWTVAARSITSEIIGAMSQSELQREYEELNRDLWRLSEEKGGIGETYKNQPLMRRTKLAEIERQLEAIRVRMREIDNLLRPTQGGMHDSAKRFEALQRFLRIYNIDMIAWIEEQAGKMSKQDEISIIEALTKIGLGDAQIKSLLGAIILCEIPGSIRLEGRGRFASRIGGLIVKTGDGYRILFPRERLSSDLLNIEHLGDLLHEVVELNLVENGMQVDNAHEQAMAARSKFLNGEPFRLTDAASLAGEAITNQPSMQTQYPIRDTLHRFADI